MQEGGERWKGGESSKKEEVVAGDLSDERKAASPENLVRALRSSGIVFRHWR